MNSQWIVRLWILVSNNFGTKLIAVLVAMIFWGIVFGSRNIEATKEVPLEVITSSDVAPVNEIPDRIAFRLSGPKAFLRSVVNRVEDPIRVNLVGTQPAMITYRFFSDNIRVPIGVKVLSIYPPSITIKLEHVKSRELPIHLQIQGTPPEGYRLGKVEVKPSTIHVAGPETKVNHLTELQSKPIDISHLKTTLEEDVPLDLAASFLRIEGKWPKVHIEVEPASANYRIKNIDVHVISALRSKVTEIGISALVRASQKDLQLMDRDQIYGIVNLEGRAKGKYEAPVEVHLPDGIGLVKVIPSQVHVTLY